MKKFLLAATFLSSLYSFQSTASTINNRLDIRTPSSMIELDNNTYTVTYSASIEPYGGALFVTYVDFDTLNNAIFTNNVLNATDTTKPGHGGAAALSNLSLNEIKNTQFINNTLNSSYNVSGSTISSGGALALLAISGTTKGVTLQNIDSCVFKGNSIQGGINTTGGALAIAEYSSVDTIKNSEFNGNYAYTDKINGHAQAGAVLVRGKLSNIVSSVFKDNYVKAVYGYVTSGAIMNQATMGNIKQIYDTTFENNHIESNSSFAFGGAIASLGGIESIKDSTFKKNKAYTTAEAQANGGAIFQQSQNIGIIDNVEFIQNEAVSVAGYASGGAINISSKIQEIKNSDFTENKIRGKKHTDGAAIYNSGTISKISNSTFSSNEAISDTGQGRGGAISNFGTITEITNSTFSNNKAVSENNSAIGGAILNIGTLSIINSDFINNSATSGVTARGGAIYANAETSIISDNYNMKFSGNTTQTGNEEKEYNAIYVSTGAQLNLSVINNGNITFDDSINGNTFLLNIDGDKSGKIYLNNEISNATNIDVNKTAMILNKGKYGQGKFNDNPNLSLANAELHIANGYLEELSLGEYSANNSILHLDVNPDTMTSDLLTVNGDVKGVTNLIIYATSDTDIVDKGRILFAQSTEDTTGNKNSFAVSRVYKSPYLYDVKYTNIAANSNEWYFEMNTTDNPDYVPEGPIKVAPEIIGFEALPSAGLAQTNGMIYNIMRKVNVNRLYCPGCGFYDYNWDGEPFHNLWVDTTYNGLEIEAPVEIDADVWGIEAGSDIQRDLHNKLGIFVSYRRGNYEMNGKGEDYFSPLSSELDINSYLGGLYYRYDNNNWYAFATLYGGMQEAEIETKDGVSSDTDGIEFGGSAELGYSYALNKTLYLTPSLGVFYTQVNYDDTTDSAGKTVEYNDLKQVELEAGLKLSKAVYTDDGFYSLYVKPSVVQTLIDGDEINVSGLGKIDTIEDETLGRIELGGSYGFNEQWSAYGWANYTFGSDYEATSIGAGVNYSW